MPDLPVVHACCTCVLYARVVRACCTFVCAQETTTVCAVGCLMSSISMAIGENNILIQGQVSNPGTLNAWLRANNGCVGVVAGGGGA
jgi:hypothetical protein